MRTYFITRERTIFQFNFPVDLVAVMEYSGGMTMQTSEQDRARVPLTCALSVIHHNMLVDLEHHHHRNKSAMIRLLIEMEHAKITGTAITTSVLPPTQEPPRNDNPPTAKTTASSGKPNIQQPPKKAGAKHPGGLDTEPGWLQRLWDRGAPLTTENDTGAGAPDNQQGREAPPADNLPLPTGEVRDA